MADEPETTTAQSKRSKKRPTSTEPPAPVTQDALDAVLAALPEEDREDAPPIPNSPPELHGVESLVAASRSLFEVAPEVLAGAVHAAGIDQTSSITIEQARAMLDTYLKQSI